MQRLLEKSARQWQIPACVARRIFLVPVVGAVIVAALRLHKDSFRFMMQEDGPIELLQVTGFALATIFGAIIVVRQFRAGLL